MCRIRRTALWCVAAALAIATVGCGGVPGLPTTLEVAVSAMDKTEAAAGSGVAGLANSVWSIERTDPATDENVDPPTSGPYGGLLTGERLDRPPVGERIFLIEFGPAGEFVEVRENRFFLPRIYGDTVEVGGDWASTTFGGVSFRSESYGVEVGERFGTAVVVNVRFGNFFLGRATLYAWGTQADDQLAGTFGYVIDFTEGVVAFLGSRADQYPITGERIEP